MTISLDGLFGAVGDGRSTSSRGAAGAHPEFRALLDGLLAPGDEGADGLLDEHLPGGWPDDEGIGPELSWSGLAALLGAGRQEGGRDGSVPLGSRLEALLADPEADIRAAELLARVDPDELEAALAFAEAGVAIEDVELPALADQLDLEQEAAPSLDVDEDVPAGDPDRPAGEEEPGIEPASEAAPRPAARPAGEEEPGIEPASEAAPRPAARPAATPITEADAEPATGPTGPTGGRVTATRSSDGPTTEAVGSRPVAGEADRPRVTAPSAPSGEPAASTEPTAPVAARATPGHTPNRPVGLPLAVERVLDAVAELEHLPPPRQLTLDLGEARIRVALDDGQVRLTLLASERGGQDLLDEAADALAQRGFDLARDGDDRGGGRDGSPAPEKNGSTETTSARARRLRASGGLRL